MAYLCSLQLVTLMSLWSLSTAQYTNTFYITPNASTTSCPGNPCYELKIYFQNSSYYFQSNTQFIFLPGNHTFDTGIPLVVEGKENISLIGSNNFTVHTVAEIVKEYQFDPYAEDKSIPFFRSESIIYCYNATGFSFSSVMNLSLINLSFINCGQLAGIYMFKIFNLLMNGVSVQNSKGYGVLGWNVLGQSFIVNSSFIANNQYVKDMLTKTSVGHLQCNGVDYDHNTAYVNNGSVDCTALAGGNMLLRFLDSTHVQNSNQLRLSNLLFSLGVDATFESQYCSLVNYATRGTGFTISLPKTTPMNVDIQDSIFYRNQASIGANIHIVDFLPANHTVSLKNVSSIRGLASCSGAGMELNIFPLPNSFNIINATYMWFNCNFITNNPESGSTFHIQIFSDSFTQLSNSSPLVLLHSGNFHNNVGFSSLKITLAISPQNIFNFVEIWNCTFMDDGDLESQYSIHASSSSEIIINYKVNPTVSLFTSYVSMSNIWLVGVDLSIGDVIFDHSKLWSFSNTIVFNGNVTFKERSSEEIGGVLYLSSSSVVIAQNSNVMFINNTAFYGGAIFIDYQSTLIFTSPCNVSFLNNEALIEGGALYVQRGLQSVSPPCFFKINDTASIPIDDNFGVNVYFEGNSAGEAGSVLYGGDIDDCMLDISMLPSPYDFPDPPNITSGELFDNITVFGPNDNSSALISSDPALVSMCVNAFNSSKWINYTGYPGQSIDLSLVTMGQRNSTTPAVVIVYTILPVVKIFNVLYTAKNCTNYSVSIGTMNETLMFITQLGIFENALNTEESGIKLSITVNLTCPNGFKLDSSIPSCMCSSLLQTYGFECNIKNETVLKFGNEWIGYSQDHLLGVVAQCPFDYCSDNKCISIHDYDSQCNYNRSKVLCGQCKENLSMMFGTSQCAACSNTYLFLVIPFAMMGIVLLLFMVTFDLTVSNGRINGLILYAFIIKLNTSIFFPSCIKSNIKFNMLSTFVSWLNLDLGIETCFYDGMGSYGKIGLQAVFPVYLCILIAVIVLSSQYSTRISRLCRYKIVPVISTIVLLIYAKMLRMIMTILTPALIYFNDLSDSPFLIWAYDGNVPFLRGIYAVLFAAAFLVVILFIIPYTVVLMCTPCLVARSHWRVLRWITKLKPFIDSYESPYKNSYRFWTGTTLFLRIMYCIVSAIFSSDPRNILMIITITHTLMIVVAGFSIYRNWAVSFIESFFHINIVVNSLYLLIFSSNDTSTMCNEDIFTTACVGTAFLCFVAILIVPCICKKVTHRMKTRRCEELSAQKCIVACCSEQESQLPALSAQNDENEFREPLLDND